MVMLALLAAQFFIVRVMTAGVAVNWTQLVNTTVSGDLLQKTSGCNGCFDAGAISAQQIASGDGFVEFAVADAKALFVAGLNHDHSGHGYAEIDLAFRFNGAGQADVLENGSYVGGDSSYVAGDVFRIEIVGSSVRFSRNGNVLLQRSTRVVYPVVLDSSTATIASAIRGATIASVVPGGFVEKAGEQTYRPRLTPLQIASFLLANGATGRFTFPSPYGTEGVRLTGPGDCANAQECVWYVGYSYWRNITRDRRRQLPLVAQRDGPDQISSREHRMGRLVQ